MTALRLAFPTECPGGLDAPLDAHFGHCGVYTLVDLEGDRILGVDTLPCVPHAEGGCLAAVDHLAGQGVRVLVASGIGRRPLLGFEAAGIQVHRGVGHADVRSAVAAFARGALPPFTPEATCAGGHHGHHEAHRP